MSIRFQVYPTSQRPGELAVQIAAAFRSQLEVIGTPPNKPKSGQVLVAVRPALEALGFRVEASKTRFGKVRVPVLYGINGAELKAFEVDAWHPAQRAILEVEAGVAIDARKLYQDLFEAIAMPDIDFACIAVQNAYHPARRAKAFDDFERARAILDSLLASGRLALPLQTLMLLGY